MSIVTIVIKEKIYFLKKELLGRVIGPNKMSHSVLTYTCNVVPRRNVHRLTPVEQEMESEQATRSLFDQGIKLVLVTQ